MSQMTVFLMTSVIADCEVFLRPKFLFRLVFHDEVAFYSYLSCNRLFPPSTKKIISKYKLQA